MSNLAGLGTFPSQSLKKVPRATTRAYNAVIEAQISTLPVDYSGMAGEVMVVKDDEDGPSTASQSGNAPLRFGNREVAFYKPMQVPIGTSDALTDAEHGGCLLVCSNVSAITLTIAITGTPTTGVSNGFECVILRETGAGEVQVVFSGVTNQNANSHTRVIERKRASLLLIETKAYFDGSTKA